MNKKVVLMGSLAVLLAGSLAAAGVYNWLLGPTQAASGQITAIPLLVVSQDTPTPSLAAAVTAAAAQSSAVSPTAEAGVTTLATPAPATEAADVQPGTGLTLLQISPAASQVRFILTEELRGQPTTVVGASDQVAGQIAVDPSNLGTVQVGVIQVNARTLATDNDRRNQAIRNLILATNSFEYITFTPTEVLGLDGSAQPGDTFAFQIAGNLTIRDVTQPVVFDVTATVDALDQLSGTAAVTINRTDYGLNIPSVPFVANVSEAVQLEIDFVAAAS